MHHNTHLAVNCVRYIEQLWNLLNNPKVIFYLENKFGFHRFYWSFEILLEVLDKNHVWGFDGWSKIKKQNKTTLPTLRQFFYFSFAFQWFEIISLPSMLIPGTYSHNQWTLSRQRTYAASFGCLSLSKQKCEKCVAMKKQFIIIFFRWGSWRNTLMEETGQW